MLRLLGRSPLGGFAASAVAFAASARRASRSSRRTQRRRHRHLHFAVQGVLGGIGRLGFGHRWRRPPGRSSWPCGSPPAPHWPPPSSRPARPLPGGADRRPDTAEAPRRTAPALSDAVSEPPDHAVIRHVLADRSCGSPRPDSTTVSIFRSSDGRWIGVDQHRHHHGCRERRLACASCPVRRFEHRQVHLLDRIDHQ